jgi:NTP pyrophosphatase (non-canonical NTP hydrolase)
MISTKTLEHILTFRKERDWEQFHKPKDLAISLSIEASELLEWFQWKSDQDIITLLQSDKRAALEDEIADVAVYLSYLIADLDINLDEVVMKKMTKNAEKYPVERVKGRSDKYDQY